MAGEIIFHGMGPLHFTRFCSEGAVGLVAEDSEDVNISKQNEPNARKSSSMAERLIMS